MKIKLELSKWVAQQKKQGQKKTTPRAQPQKKKKRVRTEDNLSFRDIENLMGSNRATYGRRHGRVVSKRR